MKLGSLCSGYGGLELATLDLWPDATVAWHAEIDPHASTVLAAHWPDVPNLGDLSAADWAGVEPVDVLTAGFPCQDVSSAGRRAGLKEGTRTGLWLEVKRAVSELRPALVLLENVPGLMSGYSEERDERIRCVCGWPDRRGGLLGDHEGFDSTGSEWLVPVSRHRHDGESAAGAERDAGQVWWDGQEDPGRGRQPGGGVGLVAQRWQQDSDPARSNSAVPPSEGGAGSATPSVPGPTGVTGPRRWGLRKVDASGVGTSGLDGRPVPSSERKGANGAGEAWMVCPACWRGLDGPPGELVRRSWFGRVLGDLAEVGYVGSWTCLRASDVGAPHRRDRVFVAATDRRNRPARSVAADTFGGAAQLRRGPRPVARPPRPPQGERDQWQRGGHPAGSGGQAPADTDSSGLGGWPELDGGSHLMGGSPCGRHPVGCGVEMGGPFGAYQPAIDRWAATIGRPAPPALDDRRLNARFVEWMMGLPDGWVTDLVPRRHALRILGNGVVPQQAAEAYRRLVAA